MLLARPTAAPEDSRYQKTAGTRSREPMSAPVGKAIEKHSQTGQKHKKS